MDDSVLNFLHHKSRLGETHPHVTGSHPTQWPRWARTNSRGRRLGPIVWPSHARKRLRLLGRKTGRQPSGSYSSGRCNKGHIQHTEGWCFPLACAGAQVKNLSGGSDIYPPEFASKARCRLQTPFPQEAVSSHKTGKPPRRSVLSLEISAAWYGNGLLLWISWFFRNTQLPDSVRLGANFRPTRQTFVCSEW